MIESGEQKVATDEKSNPWMLTVLTEEKIQLATGTLPRQGPTYKVVLEVDSVKTRALNDYGGPDINSETRTTFYNPRETWIDSGTISTVKLKTGQAASWSKWRSRRSNGCSDAETHN